MPILHQVITIGMWIVGEECHQQNFLQTSLFGIQLQINLPTLMWRVTPKI